MLLIRWGGKPFLLIFALLFLACLGYADSDIRRQWEGIRKEEQKLVAMKKALNIDRLSSSIDRTVNPLIAAESLAVLKDELPNISLGDGISSLKIRADIRLGYERFTTKNGGLRSSNDSYHQRVRIGLTFTGSGHFSFDIGMATGGNNGTSANDYFGTQSDFETGDLRLDYAYTTYKMGRMRVILGQQMNPFLTTGLLWDSDVRPVGITGKVDNGALFFTLGLYDVLRNIDAYGDDSKSDNLLVSAQIGFKGTMKETDYSIALGIHHYNHGIIDNIRNKQERQAILIRSLEMRQLQSSTFICSPLDLADLEAIISPDRVIINNEVRTIFQLSEDFYGDKDDSLTAVYTVNLLIAAQEALNALQNCDIQTAQEALTQAEQAFEDLERVSENHHLNTNGLIIRSAKFMLDPIKAPVLALQEQYDRYTAARAAAEKRRAVAKAAAEKNDLGVGKKVSEVEDGNGIVSYPYQDAYLYTSEEHNIHLLDLYLDASHSFGKTELMAYAHLVKNIGAVDSIGVGVFGGKIDLGYDSLFGGTGRNADTRYGLNPKDNDMAYRIGVDASHDKWTVGIAYSMVESDSVYGVLTDQDFGTWAGLLSTNVKGLAFKLGYQVNQHFSIAGSFFDLKRIHPDVPTALSTPSADQDKGKLIYLDLNYKF